MPVKFSTTREVRRLAGVIRDFCRVDGPFEDVGKTTGAEVRAWLETFVVDRHNHMLARDWANAPEALRARVFCEWEQLRGVSHEEKAAAWADRSNARTRAANPLFDAMDALDEVATLTTPEAVLRQIQDQHADSQERMKQPTIEERVKAAIDPDAPREKYPTLNQCIVWAQLLSYCGRPNKELALQVLARVSCEDADRMERNLIELNSWVQARIEAHREEGKLSAAYLTAAAALTDILQEMEIGEGSWAAESMSISA